VKAGERVSGGRFSPDTLFRGVHGRGVRGGLCFPLLFLLLEFFSFVIPLVCVNFSWDRSMNKQTSELRISGRFANIGPSYVREESCGWIVPVSER